VAQRERNAPRNQEARLRKMAFMRLAPSLHGHAESLAPRQCVSDLGGFVATLAAFAGRCGREARTSQGALAHPQSLREPFWRCLQSRGRGPCPSRGTGYEIVDIARSRVVWGG
jgi:hypothetical protein